MAFIPPIQLPKNVSRISISLASSDAILARSFGEISKPETVNYRTFRPEKDGLFCEKIFGPIRDWECHCGKYKRIRYRGIVCDRCGVEVTMKSVRRERAGHIALAVPVVHIWYLRSLPSKIATMLGMPTKDVERIIYYESYVVVNPGTTGLHVKDLLSEEQYLEILESLPETNKSLDEDDPKKFVALIGGEAIRQLLRLIDPEREHEQLREVARTETSQQKRAEAIKRLRVIEAFREHGDDRVLNKPEWMVMDIIPVIPPELRPLVPLEGGRFATSDLNDLYRRMIIRNNRLKKLIDIKAPEVILRNEKRMLQESVDALFDNSRRVSAVRSGSQRALKSLSDILKGKQGRFRQNLLGKRVDYSGRSVIVVGPELRMHECGLPKDMAVELFKPFIIRKLIERGIVRTVKTAKKTIERKEPEIWDILETVIDNHLVLLNRAPTLHRLGIQAFQPRLVEGKAIQIHPLVCAAFNADFDGDQMAVHIPLSHDAQLEALLLMLSTNNIVSPQNGTPVAQPSQDMVLGVYYLTKQLEHDPGEGKVFSSPDEVIIAYDNNRIGLHAKIKVRIKGKLIETTVGRVIFNQIVPVELGYLNELLTKKRLGQIIALIFRRCGNIVTARFLDDMKNLGFTYATKGGLSVNIEDIIVPAEKVDIVDRAQTEVDKIESNYRNGFMTNGERYNKIIDTWTKATSRVADKLFIALQSSKQGFNSLYMMVDSGARGSKEQVRQLSGMRGLMAKPQKSLTGQTGELIENPVISNFREGLTILEYFISTHGARKGLADTALKTADAGYLTRRLVDVAQDVVITEIDCGTIRGANMTALKEGEDIKEPLYERILGRVPLTDVTDPISGELVMPAGAMIDEDYGQKISETSIEEVFIRSVLTCEARRGICAKCYGRNLTTGKLVDIGEAVGVIAAQSIGEPGTQLTLRTFHTGGTATLIASQSQVMAKFEGKVEFDTVKKIMREDGKEVVIGRSGVVHVLDKDNRVISKYDIPYGSVLMVREGARIAKGELIYERDPYNAVIITEFAGAVRYKDLIQEVTYREEPDEQTGHITKAVIDSRDRTKTPTLEIVRTDGKVSPYIIPTHAHLIVDDGVPIGAGEILVKIPRETGKTRDITGGLPRVTELFEARSHSDYAVIAEIDGIVSFDKPKRGARVLVITSHDGKVQREYTIPIGKHVLVQVSDTVRAGERVTDGIINPRDILRIQGVSKVQEYLVNEIQDVYRMQGVKLNDKHIEVIVRQMLQKVRVVDPGDTGLLMDDQVDRAKFLDENETALSKVVVTARHDSKFKIGQLVNKRKFKETNAELRKKGKTAAESRAAEPATSEPVLLGITQASLTTESFISAASFQETTKVLTDAAVEGKVDFLYGLKENVIVGHLIPAGTGLKKYQELLVTSSTEDIFADYTIAHAAPKPEEEQVPIAALLAKPKQEVQLEELD